MISQRYCENCKEYKLLEQFKKYGKECKDCKISREKDSTKRFYEDRYKCICGSYISKANPKEKHEQTKGHQDYIQKGYKYDQNYDLDDINRFKKHWKGFARN